jgi:hypothetical protein
MSPDDSGKVADCSKTLAVVWRLCWLSRVDGGTSSGEIAVKYIRAVNIVMEIISKALNSLYRWQRMTLRSFHQPIKGKSPIQIHANGVD